MNDSGSTPKYRSMTNRDDNNIAVLSHLLPVLGFMLPGLNVVIPLIIWLIKRDQSIYIEHHARESLNFQLSITLLAVFWLILLMVIVGWVLLPLVPIVIILVLIFMIRAAIKAAYGQLYRYPLSLRLVN